MRASTPMTRNVTVIPPELPLRAAWEIMKRERIRHIPIVRAGALFGMLSDRDVLVRGTLSKDGKLEVPEGIVSGEAMTPPPLHTCEPTTDVVDLARLMTEEKIDAVPVVRGLRLVGLVTSTDLMQLLIRQDEARPLPFDFELVEQRMEAL